MKKPEITGSLVFKIATWAMFAGLLSLQLYKMQTSGLHRDDAIFSVVSKSLAQGEGYGLVFFDKISLFSHQVGTGPTLILLAGLFIWLFGNQHWVPSLSVIILIQVLIVAIFILSKPLLQGHRWSFSFIALMLMLMLTEIRVINGPEEIFAAWHLMLGDIPSALFAVAAIMIGCQAFGSTSINRKKLFLAGAAFGCAVLTKLLAGIAFFSFCTVIVVYCLYRRQACFLPLFFMGSGFGLPLLGFELAKVASLGISGYQQYYEARWFQINDGALTQDRAIDFFLSSTPFITTLLIIILLFKDKVEAFRREHLTAWLVAFILAFAALLQSVWWIFLSIQHDRYLLQANIYVACSMAILLANLSSKNRYHQYGLLVFLFAYAVIFHAERVRYFIGEAYHPDPLLADQLKARQALIDLQEKGSLLFACGDNFELEYLLPKGKNFRPCTELPAYMANYPEKETLLISSYYNSLSFGNTIVVIRQNYPVARLGAIPDKILRRCDTILARHGDMEIRRCGP